MWNQHPEAWHVCIHILSETANLQMSCDTLAWLSSRPLSLTHYSCVSRGHWLFAVGLNVRPPQGHPEAIPRPCREIAVNLHSGNNIPSAILSAVMSYIIWF